ncbi:MAG: SurA N-terminal domain-containing protein [Deltaproteobacteria bacterium]|nr:SurA N-terminal domain-containing protein [Deltaproteobacteria bacterium]
MLSQIRKNANSTVVWLIIGAISIVFIFLGMGGPTGSSYTVTVNGEEADPNEYDELLREAGSLLRQTQTGPEVENNARMAALNEQISRILIRQFGENMGLAPSPRALREAVAAMEFFQVDGRFNLELYQAALRAQRRSAADFERELRRNLTSERAISLALGLARTYRPEMTELFHFQEDQVRFDYLFLADEDEDIQPTAEDLGAYFALRQEKWRRPAEMTVQYVSIIPADYLEQADFTEAELEYYYAQHQDRFLKPEAAETRQILFSFPSLSPGEEEKSGALARAEEAGERLAQGADFAVLAQELSDDRNTAETGGYLGFLTRGSTFPEIEEAAFSGPLNEVIGPVATPAGYHLIKVTDRHQAGPSPLAEVREELSGELKARRARQTAVNLMEDLLTRTEINPDLEDAARRLGLRAAMSRAFTAENAPFFFEDNPEAVQRAFQAPLDKVAPPFEGDRTLVLYIPRSRQESAIPPLDEVREEVERDWRREAADSLTRRRLESYLPEIEARGWEAFLADQGMKSGTGQLTHRNALSASPPFEGSDARAVTALAYSVAKPGQVVPVSLAGRLEDLSGRFLLRLAEYQAADESRLDGPEGRTFEYFLALNKSNLFFHFWRQGLYEASRDRINIPPNFID